jgi:hypothetical protein
VEATEATRRELLMMSVSVREVRQGKARRDEDDVAG